MESILIEPRCLSDVGDSDRRWSLEMRRRKGWREGNLSRKEMLGPGVLDPLGFPGGSVVKESPCNAGDTGDAGLIPGWEDPLEEEMATHSSILPGESHGQRNLVGYTQSTGSRRVRLDQAGTH